MARPVYSDVLYSNFGVGLEDSIADIDHVVVVRDIFWIVDTPDVPTRLQISGDPNGGYIFWTAPTATGIHAGRDLCHQVIKVGEPLTVETNASATWYVRISGYRLSLP